MGRLKNRLVVLTSTATARAILAAILTHPSRLLQRLFVAGYHRLILHRSEKGTPHKTFISAFTSGGGSHEPDPPKYDPSTIISPSHGHVFHNGPIDTDAIQTKGGVMSIRELTRMDLDLDGHTLMTIYLPPSVYHGIHAPVKGVWKGHSTFGGRRYPIDRFGFENSPETSTTNERTVCTISTDRGDVIMVCVSSHVVGSIAVDPEREIDSIIEAGERIGFFTLGSMVHLIVPPTYSLDVDDRVSLFDILGGC